MGAVLVDPRTSPEVYETIVLDGLVSPGPCGLTADCRRKLKLEDQQSPGFTGAFVVLRGEELPVLDYKLRLWAPVHYTDGGPFVDVLLDGLKKRLQRVIHLQDQTIAHLGIDKVTVESVGSLRQVGEGKERYELGFSLKAYQKRKPLQNAPRGPKTETEKQIEQLNNENAKLQKELDAAERAANKGK